MRSEEDYSSDLAAMLEIDLPDDIPTGTKFYTGDGAFPYSPPIGSIYYDTIKNLMWVRVKNKWQKVSELT